MDLAELLEIQAELNSHVPGIPSREDWEMALLCEIGELCNSLRDGMPGRAGWVWWKRADRPPSPASREEVLEELADILHFCLVGRVLGFVHMPVSDLSHLWERGWKESIGTSLAALLRGLCGTFDNSYLYGFVPQIAKELGFDREELSAAYLAKVVKNRERWKEAESAQ